MATELRPVGAGATSTNAADPLGDGFGKHDVKLSVAVSDGPQGTDVVLAPSERHEALELRQKHANKFWCSDQARGCGSRLTLTAGAILRPHFRHLRSDVACQHRLHPQAAERSYEHLHYQHALKAWLGSQGFEACMEHTFDEGGRADLHVIVEGLSHSIEVQLSPIGDETWGRRDEMYRQSVNHVTWLYGPNAESAAAREQALRGWSLLIAEGVQLGVRGHTTQKSSPLDQCQMTPEGLLVPGLQEAKQEHEAFVASRRAAEQEAAAAAAARQQAMDRRAQISRHRKERPPTRTGHYTGVVQLPPPPQAALDTWQELHPEAGSWAPNQGWGFLQNLEVSDHDAARFITYLCGAIYDSGPLTMFDVQGIRNLPHILSALENAGLIVQSEQGEVSRWTRNYRS